MSDYFAPMAPDAMGQLRLAGGDANLFVLFERRSRLNRHKSEIEGRPIYEPVDFIKIQQPGERDRFEGPVTDEHKRRFPDRWRQYLEKAEQIPEGTPVELLFPNEKHIVDTLLDLKIQTIEQLASLTEQGIERLGMDGRKYVAKAVAALDRSEAVREVTRLEHVITQQSDEIAVLKRANDDLAARMAAMERLMQERTYPPPAAYQMPQPQPSPSLGGQFPLPPPPLSPLGAGQQDARRLHLLAEDTPPERPGLVP